jgi:hypothetical protein
VAVYVGKEHLKDAHLERVSDDKRIVYARAIRIPQGGTALRSIGSANAHRHVAGHVSLWRVTHAVLFCVTPVFADLYLRLDGSQLVDGNKYGDCTYAFTILSTINIKIQSFTTISRQVLTDTYERR